MRLARGNHIALKLPNKDFGHICSKKCDTCRGYTKQTLLRYFLSVHFKKYLVNGVWSLWTLDSKCSKTCGGGTGNASRLCNNPSPAFNGAHCNGADTKVDHMCNIGHCPGTYSTYTCMNFVTFINE